MKILFSPLLTLLFFFGGVAWAEMEAPPAQEPAPAASAPATLAPVTKAKKPKVKKERVKKQAKAKAPVENTETGGAVAPPATAPAPAAVAEPAKAEEPVSAPEPVKTEEPKMAEPKPVAKPVSETPAPAAEPVAAPEPVSVPAAEAVPEPASPLYTATYRSGSAPLKVKSKVTITKKGEAYQMAMRGELPWEILLKNIRGAQVSTKGLWFYWFDASDNTLVGFFEMDDAPALASEINTSVAAYQEAHNTDAKYQSDYDAYKEKALQQSQ